MNLFCHLTRAASTVFLSAFISLAANVSAQTVAITIDDGPDLEQTPRLSPAQRNQAMLNALAKHGVSAALFVTADYAAKEPAGYALAKAWGDAGHAIGNHSMSHPDLHSDKVSLAQYQQEILDCDAIISTLPGYQKWYRYTYLREGNTPEKRDGMRDFLKQKSYRNAYVSLDTSDWRLNEKLIAVLKKNPEADVTPVKLAYLAHIRQRAEAYRALSWQLQGRDIPQVLLMHHNLINALWLDDVLAQFKIMGWKFVTPAAAFNDPVYQLAPEREAAGQSLLLSMSRTLGLGKFTGWERLVDDGDFEIEALKKQGL
ncbi:polysaccharide deacetylase family protein [Undibacterium pigrum]|uniref:Peptidoglycan/xylan/chitin deacetylase (PgdA/CDA1 family) n=1 Tax=Undibacterium pigrum TaxID=401470 RepID=A0A318J9A3_9BURK|nr:polysaccharide deacetylase family protein [Undibacterium pigrum]PXX43150.1 peptidoglycan/xylan/chitin deacetylase (PgdA/CDA1 family) [Undibacterium pigrum]